MGGPDTTVSGAARFHSASLCTEPGAAAEGASVRKILVPGGKKRAQSCDRLRLLDLFL